MEACLAAIQKGLLLLLAASLAIAVVTLPQPENRRLLSVLEELETFRASFDVEAARRTLRAQAEAHGQLDLALVENAARTKRAPKLKVAQGAGPVRPLSALTLATLDDVATHAVPGATVAIGVPDAESLAGSLLWRMARSERSGAFTVRSIELLPAEVTREDAALEREVAELRLASLDAREALDEATRRVETLERRAEIQAKVRSWKVLAKTQEQLAEARTTLDTKTRTHADTQQRYEEAAKRAERPRKTTSAGDVPEAALARVVIENRDEVQTFDVPVALEQRNVAVVPLPLPNFTATREAALWDEVKGTDAAGAIAAVRSHFSWHFRGIQLGGIALSGRWVLSLLPLVLPLLLGLLLARMRRAETAYSPFRSDVLTAAPRVGLNNRAVEFIAIVVVPLLAVASAALALFFINQPAILPMLAAIACVTLGAQAFSKMADVREQTLSIVRTHSVMPPAPKG